MRFVQSQTDSKYCSYGLDSQGLSKHEALPLTTSLLLQWLSSLPSRLTKNRNNEKSLYRIITFYIFTTKFFMKSFAPLLFLNIRYTDIIKYT